MTRRGPRAAVRHVPRVIELYRLITQEVLGHRISLRPDRPRDTASVLVSASRGTTSLFPVSFAYESGGGVLLRVGGESGGKWEK